MTLFSQTITNSDQDGYERGNDSGLDITGTAIIVRANSSAANQFWGLIVVENVTIPKNSTVSNAVLKIAALSASYDSIDCTLYIQDVDDAPDLASPNDDIVNRAQGGSGTVWDEDDFGTSLYASPSFHSDLQSHFARAGWASGNNLAILMVPSSSTTTQCRFNSADAGSNQPVVEITYTAPAGGGDADLERGTIRGVFRGVLRGV